MTCSFMFFVTLLREVTFARVYKEKNFFLWYTAHLFVTLLREVTYVRQCKNEKLRLSFCIVLTKS